MTYYLHTLDGGPAMFDGEQIYFAQHYGSASPLVVSLRQIRKEQRTSRRYRKESGFEDSLEYGYRRVRLPRSKETKG